MILRASTVLLLLALMGCAAKAPVEPALTEAEEAVRRARPSWFQRHGFTIGVIVGTGITVALVAAVAKTLRISIEGA